MGEEKKYKPQETVFFKKGETPPEKTDTVDYSMMGPTLVVKPIDEIKRQAMMRETPKPESPQQTQPSYHVEEDYNNGAPKLEQTQQVNLQAEGIEVEEFDSLDSFLSEGDVEGQSKRVNLKSDKDNFGFK